MAQKLSAGGFNWVKDASIFNKYFIKNCNEDSGTRYFLEVDFQYPEKLHETHIGFRFLPERVKIGKLEKFVSGLKDKNDYVVHIRTYKEVLNHGLVLQKVHRVIKFNQKAWLKPYIDINAELRKNRKK